MKKVLSILLLAGITSLVACGPSAEEKAAAEKAKQDSIATVQKAEEDAKNAAAAAEKAKQDSVANAANEKMKADSIAAAVEAAAKKHAAPKVKPAAQIKPGQPLPGRPGAVKK